MTHFVECAMFMATRQSSLLPILESGMLVRDFAISVRDAYSIPLTHSVVLCDGETGKPLRGMQWLLPNSAVQIKVVNSLQSLLAVEAEARKKAREDTAMASDTFCQNASVHVYLDAVITPSGDGIGGISLTGHLRPHIMTHIFPNARTAEAVDLLLLKEAIRYVKKTAGVDAIPYVHCASVHIHAAAVAQGTPKKYIAGWVDIDTDALTEIRKKAVRDAAVF